MSNEEILNHILDSLGCKDTPLKPVLLAFLDSEIRKRICNEDVNYVEIEEVLIDHLEIVKKSKS